MEFESAAGLHISVIIDSIGILRRKSYLHSCNLNKFVIVSGQQQKTLNYFPIAVREPVQFLSTSMGLSVMMLQDIFPHRKKSQRGLWISDSFWKIVEVFQINPLEWSLDHVKLSDMNGKNIYNCKKCNILKL